MDFLLQLGSIYIERTPFFLRLISEHLLISLAAIALASSIGIVLGIIAAEFKKTSQLILTTTNVLYTIPTIALLGILITFTGVGNLSAIIALTLYGLLPMVRTTYTGIEHIDNSIIESALGMGTTPFQLLYKVKLPLAFPVIFSGLRSMSIMTIALCGVASFIGAGGLGVAIYRGITTNNSVLTVSGSLLIVFIAIATDIIFAKIEKKIKTRRRKTTLKPLVIFTTLTCLVFLSVFFFKNRANLANQQVIIATKPQTEQFILAEMIKALIEKQSDLTAKIIKGVGGGTANIHPGMLNGEFDMYPEYTGTAWRYVLKNGSEKDSDKLYRVLTEQYIDNYKLKWIGLYGFNNTYTLAVKDTVADTHALDTFSDLAKISADYKFGAEYDFFERQDGYIGLIDTYKFKFKSTMDMDIGLKFEAIKANKVDVINAFSTDGMIKAYDLKVLKDDQNFFETYYAGTVIRTATLEKHPELATILAQLNGIISDEEMVAMNYAVENDKRDEKSVALEFLTKKGLL